MDPDYPKFTAFFRVHEDNCVVVSFTIYICLRHCSTLNIGHDFINEIIMTCRKPTKQIGVKIVLLVVFTTILTTDDKTGRIRCADQ